MQNFKDLKFINLKGRDKLDRTITHGLVQTQDPESYTTWEGPSQCGPSTQMSPKVDKLKMNYKQLELNFKNQFFSK